MHLMRLVHNTQKDCLLLLLLLATRADSLTDIISYHELRPLIGPVLKPLID